MIFSKIILIALICDNVLGTNYPTFAPYFDIVMGNPKLNEVYEKTGQNVFRLAFVIGSTSCNPQWGGVLDIADSGIISQIEYIRSKGGEVIVSTGGANGPYLETLCKSVDSLADAYKKIIDTVKTNHLDVDIETSIPIDNVTQALAIVQKQRGITVSFTLMVQDDNYGLNPQLGVDVLKSAKKNKLNVNIVNPMAMEFPSSRDVWGEAVIAAAESTLKQMKEIWPELNEDQLKQKLSVTPMIGKNYNGRIFLQSDAEMLVQWAQKNKIGSLSFWSANRDNGGCPDQYVQPSCSSIQQSEYEFTKIFQKFHST